jgi:hypothetical protein
MWSYVVHNLSKRYFQLTFMLSLTAAIYAFRLTDLPLDCAVALVIRGQDGVFFHRAVAVLLLYLEPVDTYRCFCVHRHDGSAGRRMYLDFLAN